MEIQSEASDRFRSPQRAGVVPDLKDIPDS
jgi:hypothetical protein